MTTAMSLLNIIIKLRKLLVCLLCSFCIFNILKYTICVIVYCDVVNVQPRFNLSEKINKAIMNLESHKGNLLMSRVTYFIPRGPHRKLRQPKTEAINPFSAPACQISGLKSTRTNLQTVYFWSYNKCDVNSVRFGEHPFTYYCEKEKKKSRGLKKIALSLIVFE